ncbi:hypothetical protein EVAR_19527_1 [Eumeta japonica]|uniref:Uncharacterized protein n=1 Tax=Eumeta variegata TaxID=151549 RepID=A0A4C1UG01_EUMVA|nr:hypothetical protein EVAR_19527_1 [Eumeta japonica]
MSHSNSKQKNSGLSLATFAVDVNPSLSEPVTEGARHGLQGSQRSGLRVDMVPCHLQTSRILLLGVALCRLCTGSTRWVKVRNLGDSCVDRSGRGKSFLNVALNGSISGSLVIMSMGRIRIRIKFDIRFERSGGRAPAPPPGRRRAIQSAVGRCIDRQRVVYKRKLSFRRSSAALSRETIHDGILISSRREGPPERGVRPPSTSDYTRKIYWDAHAPCPGHRVPNIETWYIRLCDEATSVALLIDNIRVRDYGKYRQGRSRPSRNPRVSATDA